ncbi:MAG: choice-of-anchor L domain-containing protein [bacterium]
MRRLAERSTPLAAYIAVFAGVAGAFAACVVSPDKPGMNGNDAVADDAVSDGDEDVDGDGFSRSDGDCNDLNSQINPGAFEILGNGVDDDCDGSVDEPVGLCDCDESPDPSVGRQLAHAMGLCDDWIIDIEGQGDPLAYGAFSDWGAIVPRVSSDAGASDGLPIDNCRFVIMATGPARSPEPRDSDLSDLGIYDVSDPSPSPDGAVINDLTLLRVRLKAPTNAQGFAFDFVFFSSEYPDFVCSKYNDTFTAVVIDEPLLSGGAATNISRDGYGSEITVNSAFFEYPPYWSLDISGTGYGVGPAVTWCENDPVPGCSVPAPCPTIAGSTTGWLRTYSPVSAGGEITLVLSVHDEEDNILDSAVVVDNFRWIAHPVGVPQTVK